MCRSFLNVTDFIPHASPIKREAQSMTLLSLHQNRTPAARYERALNGVGAGALLVVSHSQRIRGIARGAWEVGKLSGPRCILVACYVPPRPIGLQLPGYF